MPHRLTLLGGAIAKQVNDAARGGLDGELAESPFETLDQHGQAGRDDAGDRVHAPISELGGRHAACEFARRAAQPLYHRWGLLLLLQLGPGGPHVQVLEPDPKGVPFQLYGWLPERWDLGRAVSDTIVFGKP